MRVYEFAKKHNLPSKEVIARLKGAGWAITSHMSVIPPEALAFLTKKPSAVSAPSSIPAKIKTEEKKSAVQAVVTPSQNDVQKAHKDQRRKTFQQSSSAPRKTTYKKQKKHEKKDVPDVSEIVVSQELPLREVADRMGKNANELIIALMKKGMLCNKNHILSVDTIRDLAQLFGITVHIETKEEKKKEKREISHLKTVARWPIVVVMGHVDHGKTTLLDYVRNMKSAAKEKGGITQHLGAYEVISNHGKIIFLDTPGHEAFTYIRKKGARITDLAVLVVAVDDGVKPQTVEAIKHARDAGVTLVVALNKIDKLSSGVQVETVKRQLAEHGLIPEDWGGDVVCVPVSAKTGQGIDDLLEMIVLQSQLMDLKAHVDVPARAFVLESKVDKGYGSLVSVIPVEGTLHVGDYFICGDATGKVRLLIDSFGERITQAEVSKPVQVVGFDKFVSLGEWLEVVPQKVYAKTRSSGKTGVTTTGIGAWQPHAGDTQKTINLIVKADVQGSLEAIHDIVRTLNKQHKNIPTKIVVVNASIGDISEKDVDLAVSTNSFLIGFHVKAERNAVSSAKAKEVLIHKYDVIYHLAEYLEEELEKHRVVEKILTKVGEARVLKVFAIKGAGTIAGCAVLMGVFAKGNKIVCIRDGEKQGEGEIISLQRERKTVKEVHAGYECGFVSKGFDDWKEDDIVHAFKEEEKK